MGAEKTPEDRGFPNPEEFDSYDKVESEDGQAELPEDSFEEPTSTEDENEVKCC